MEGGTGRGGGEVWELASSGSGGEEEKRKRKRKRGSEQECKHRLL